MAVKKTPVTKKETAAKKAPAKKAPVSKTPVAKKAAVKKAPAKTAAKVTPAKARAAAAAKSATPARKITALREKLTKTQMVTEIAENTGLNRKEVNSVLEEVVWKLLDVRQLRDKIIVSQSNIRVTNVLRGNG